jgi:hypothetical protein
VPFFGVLVFLLKYDRTFLQANNRRKKYAIA